jgi:transcriptional regulator with XRE-family HTH domain
MEKYETELYKIIGDMLKAARRQKNMTLEQAGKKIDVTAQTINRYETGIRKIGVNKLMALAAIYGIDYAKFMDMAQYRLAQKHPELVANPEKKEKGEKYYFDDEAAEIAQEVYSRPELKMLFSASRNVSAEDLKAVIAIVERMKKDSE